MYYKSTDRKYKMSWWASMGMWALALSWLIGTVVYLDVPASCAYKAAGCTITLLRAWTFPLIFATLVWIVLVTRLLAGGQCVRERAVVYEKAPEDVPPQDLILSEDVEVAAEEL